MNGYLLEIFNWIYVVFEESVIELAVSMLTKRFLSKNCATLYNGLHQHKTVKAKQIFLTFLSLHHE